MILCGCFLDSLWILWILVRDSFLSTFLEILWDSVAILVDPFRPRFFPKIP